MDWDLGSKLSKLGQVAGDALRAGRRQGAKLVEDVVEAPPIMDTFTGTADKVDRAMQRYTAPRGPQEVKPGEIATHPVVAPGATVAVVPQGGLKLTANVAMASFGLHLDQAGEARLDLTAAGPGTNWGAKGRESAVMSVYVDGKYSQDVVLWGGDRPNQYGLTLGNLPAGDHTISVRYAREKLSLIHI